MRQIVIISGHTCAGKSGLATRLHEDFGYHIIRTSDILRSEAEKRQISNGRKSLQELGDKIDDETDSRWIFDEVDKRASALDPPALIVVDNIRTAKQLNHFRQSHQYNVVHAHLYTAPREALEQRFERRKQKSENNEGLSYSETNLIKNEADISFFKEDADVRINTARTDGRDTLVRVAARLGLYSPPDVRCVDVLVGGQYGSEGKGHVAAYLAREYDVLVRVGGPNAGHTVSSGSGIYTYHQLPSGAKDTTARLLLGPGMTINYEQLLDEITECKITPDRLFIDPQAMIISKEDIASERGLVETIGSTGQGSGAAAARRILNRKPGLVKLARDIPELREYVGDAPNYRGSTSRQLELAYNRSLSILLEGTQGSRLSLYHGEYPYVTSRDTNVAGCLAEAGISPSRVRRILMVIRPTPIRVAHPDGNEGHSSGGLKHEVDFRIVAEQAKLNPQEVKSNEKTSTTNRDRRVGWFEWEHFRNACALNAPSDIVLTFADYIHADNQNARRFEQLHEDTIKFIEEIERIAQAPVSLINTRFPRDTERTFDLRTVIDRRNWTAQRNLISAVGRCEQPMLQQAAT